jgi:phosphoglycerate kinase
MKSVEELALKDRRVFLRVDFNVPLAENGEIRDDTRVRASLPTIRYLLDEGAKLVVASHLGRPKGKKDPKLSLAPVARLLSGLIPNKVIMAPDVVGDEVTRLKQELKAGELLLLENVRYYREEEGNDPAFSKKLAEAIDIFVNDAFGSSHRAHASVVGIAAFVPVKAAGFLMKEEVDQLRQAIDAPERPYVAILGGAKVSDKIEVIQSLIAKADAVLIGGAMAYTFLKAQGQDVGRSLAEDDQKDTALSILRTARERKVDLRLPVDHVLATATDAAGAASTVPAPPFPPDLMGVDIGPRTVDAYARLIASARTIFWNGPLGVFENPAFAHGTVKIAEAVAASCAVSIVGGGDSIAALKQAGVTDRITHISTGGGASLEFIAYGTLPGIDALEK